MRAHAAQGIHTRTGEPTSVEPAEPTAYEAVNVVLRELLANVREILGEQFVGMYLYGSLASGDFSPQTSDVDFVVVSDGELSECTVVALTSMHARLGAGESKWWQELEGSYIPLSALRRYDPGRARHLHVERGKARPRIEEHHEDWIIQRHILREQGVVLAGPAPATIIDPVDPSEIRRAVLALLRGWWATVAREPSRLTHSGYWAYAVLTMCRALYALETGAIVSKPIAARWALGALDKRWKVLIEQAMAWRDGAEFDDLPGTVEFIRYAVERGELVDSKHKVNQKAMPGTLFSP